MTLAAYIALTSTLVLTLALVVVLGLRRAARRLDERKGRTR